MEVFLVAPPAVGVSAVGVPLGGIFVVWFSPWGGPRV